VIERVAAYLAEKNQPVSSQELVQNVLKMTNVPAAMADRLVSTLVKDDPQFIRDEQGLWQFRQAQASGVPLLQQSFFLCSARPERVAHWSLYQRIALAKWENGRMEIHSVLSDHFIENLSRLSPELLGQGIIVPGWGNQVSQISQLLRQIAGDRVRVLTSIRDLAQLAFPDLKIVRADQLAELVKTPAYHDADAGLEMKILADQWYILLQMVQQQGIQTIEQMRTGVERVRPTAVFDLYVYDENFLRSLPTDAGVYVMYDRNEVPIYVGKAKNIQERLKFYFQATAQVDEKLTEIRRQLADVRIIPTGSELEARLLEFKLIQQWDPPINRQVQVRSRPHRKKNRFPRIVVIQSPTIDHASLYFIHPEKHLLSVALLRRSDACPSQIFDHVVAIERQDALEAILENYFFTVSSAATVSDPLREIAISWLSEYETKVESIDMRHVLQAKEASRLVTAYLRYDRVAEPRIFY
jgi:hypothetical protein